MEGERELSSHGQLSLGTRPPRTRYIGHFMRRVIRKEAREKKHENKLIISLIRFNSVL